MIPATLLYVAKDVIALSEFLRMEFLSLNVRWSFNRTCIFLYGGLMKISGNEETIVRNVRCKDSCGGKKPHSLVSAYARRIKQNAAEGTNNRPPRIRARANRARITSKRRLSNRHLKRTGGISRRGADKREEFPTLTAGRQPAGQPARFLIILKSNIAEGGSRALINCLARTHPGGFAIGNGRYSRH